MLKLQLSDYEVNEEEVNKWSCDVQNIENGRKKEFSNGPMPSKLIHVDFNVFDVDVFNLVWEMLVGLNKNNSYESDYYNPLFKESEVFLHLCLINDNSEDKRTTVCLQRYHDFAFITLLAIVFKKSIDYRFSYEYLKEGN